MEKALEAFHLKFEIYHMPFIRLSDAFSRSNVAHVRRILCFGCQLLPLPYCILKWKKNAIPGTGRMGTGISFI